MGFFRMTFAKVALFLIILFMFSLLPIVPALYQYRCEGCIGVEYHNVWHTLVNASAFQFVTYFTFFLELLASYPLSCVIIFATKKIK